MDQSSSPQNRKTRRSNVLMTATLELSGASLPVRLRNLSAEGALVEGEKLPVEGAAVQFRKGDLVVAARIAWVKGRNAGVAFFDSLNPEQVMRHVPTPRARVKPDFRRPGLRVTGLSQEERLASEHLVWAGPINLGD
ncbi:PilZ domain-containing protein [Sphingomonas sp. LY160]|uniref:PilZ domain-containing protein n=1 Tax=Sphingomonas sp. LY160 TaxID=3095342 RepID=UPI002ADEC426|nr:PilZ domain-containing protein [Sphingomonas sp. LY160]MEA1071468.1 PilZ domain-containing protein [Sphingomonas sp. LY160]